MKNKLSILASIVLTLFAFLMPNNVRADEKAKELLKSINKTTPGTLDEDNVIRKVEDYFIENFIFEREKGRLTYNKWFFNSDPDRLDLFKRMLTVATQWDLSVPNDPAPYLWGSEYEGLDEILEALDVPCGFTALHYRGQIIPEGFLKKLKIHSNLKCLEGEIANKAVLKALVDSYLEDITITNTSYTLDTTPIAEALLKAPPLKRLKLIGQFNVNPLFITHDTVKVESREEERFPQLDCLDLSECLMGDLETLSRTKSDVFSPLELVGSTNILWNMFPIKALVGHGGNLETLTINGGWLSSDIVKEVIDMMADNHVNRGKLSHIRFINFFHFGIITEENEKKYLSFVLQASSIPGRLELEGLSILGQTDVIDFPVDPKILENKAVDVQ